jgi:hypothetical protein
VHLEVLLEEISAEAALQVLIPRILPNATFALHPYQGKRDLLAKLPSRLDAYAKWIRTADTRVVVLVDEDRQDCLELKKILEDAAERAGLDTLRTASQGRPPLVLTRIAVEELEAWFFGDCHALRTAYPRVPKGLEHRSQYRDPDAIGGGTWEALERVLQRAGHHPGGLQKLAAAAAIAQQMVPSRNRSASFRMFCAGLQAL